MASERREGHALWMRLRNSGWALFFGRQAMTETHVYSNKSDNRAAKLQTGRKTPVDISNDSFINDEFERLFEFITNAERFIVSLNERLNEYEITIHKQKSQISELSSHKSAASEQAAK